MATVDRIRPAYAPWTPSASGYAAKDAYTGRHRAPGTRMLSVARMFYRGRHRRG